MGVVAGPAQAGVHVVCLYVCFHVIACVYVRVCMFMRRCDHRPWHACLTGVGNLRLIPAAHETIRTRTRVCMRQCSITLDARIPRHPPPQPATGRRARWL